MTSELYDSVRYFTAVAGSLRMLFATKLITKATYNKTLDATFEKMQVLRREQYSRKST